MLNALWRPRGNKFNICIPNTVIFPEDDGQVSWYFTSKQGGLKRKSEKSVGHDVLECSVQQFLTKAVSRPDVDPVHDVAAFATDSSGKRRSISVAELELADLQMFRQEIRVFQEHIQSDHPRILCIYKQDANNVTFSCKIVYKNQGGLDREIRSIAGKLCSEIHSNSGRKIHRIKIHFIQGVDGRLWFVHCNDIVFNDDVNAAISNKPMKECAGEFCGYPSELVCHSMTPVDDLVKIAYRTVMLGKESIPKDRKLEIWVKSKNANNGKKLKSIQLVEPSYSSMQKSGKNSYILQENDTEISWSWSGAIKRVNVTLVDLDEIETIRLTMAESNSGRQSVFIPKVCTPVMFWRIKVVDGQDSSVYGYSDAFLLGEADGAVPAYDMDPPPGCCAAVEKSSFHDIHNLINYHKQVKICSTCNLVYRQLEAIRLSFSMAPTEPTLRFEISRSESAEENRTEKRSNKNEIFKRLAQAKPSNNVYTDAQKWNPFLDLRKRDKKTSNRKKLTPTVSLPTLTKIKPERKKKIETKNNVKEERLDIADIDTSSDLFQVLCHLSLGKVTDLKRIIQMADTESLSFLAYSKVEGGILIPPPKSRNHVQDFNNQGNGVLSILTEFMTVCHFFVFVMDNMTSNPVLSLTHARAAQSVTTLEKLCRVHKLAQPRLHIVNGANLLLQQQLSRATDEWKLAVSLSARLEGMWSYNVAVSHLLIGRSNEDLKQRHFAAASAIFSRLEDAYELQIMQKKNDDIPEISVEESRQIIQNWRQKLHQLKVLPVYLEDGDLLQYAKEVQNVLETAETNIEIFVNTDTFHNDHPFRKYRIKQSLDLLERKANALVVMKNSSSSSEASTVKFLFEACNARDLERLDTLMSEWKSAYGTFGKAIDEQGNTLLHLSAYDNWIKGIHICLSFGIPIDSLNNHRDTPLTLALDQNHDTAIALLTALGG